VEAKKVIGKFVFGITASIYEGGEISIENIVGPTSNKGLCYGILELAKDKIREGKAESKIIKPKSLLSVVEGMKKS